MAMPGVHLKTTRINGGSQTIMNISTQRYFITYCCCALLSLLLANSIYAQGKQLSAKVDRNKIAVDESFNLTIRFRGQPQSQPDLSLLNQQFKVFGTNSNSQMSITNGRRESYTEWQVSLMPIKVGTLYIPSFNVDGAISDAIELTVSPPAPTPSGKLQDVFLETIVDKSSAYVQEQIKVTYRLYYSVNVDSLEADELDLGDTIIEGLPEAAYQRSVSGKQYRVAEFSYALFPQSSGQLTIPVLNWQLGLRISGGRTDFFGRSMGRTRAKQLRTQEKTITIKPKPGNFPANAEWLPASSLEISETWSSDTFTLGEPVTLNLTTIAKGLSSSQLPKFLDANLTSGKIKYYADQPQVVDDKGAEGITAKRVESAAVVISEPGLSIIPAIRIPWWDVIEDRLRYAEIPQKPVNVTGTLPSNTAKTSETAEVSQSGGSSKSGTSETYLDPLQVQELDSLKLKVIFYQIVFVASLMLTALFATLWLRGRKKKTENKLSPEARKLSQSMRALQTSCKNNEAFKTRQHLLLWASNKWKDVKIQSLMDISSKVENEELESQICLLDKTLYGNRAEFENWNGQALAEALKTWLKQNNPREEKEGDLKPLYR